LTSALLCLLGGRCRYGLLLLLLLLQLLLLLLLLHLRLGQALWLTSAC
jgi:hypothetical protein